jgi:hypothetical protein
MLARSPVLFYFVDMTSRGWNRMRSDRRVNTAWIKKGKKIDEHYTKILQVKFKHTDKTRNIEQGWLRKSKNIIVLIVYTGLVYYWSDNNYIPKLTRDENDCCFISNSRFIVILQKIGSLIQTFVKMFAVSYIRKCVSVHPFC